MPEFTTIAEIYRFGTASHRDRTAFASVGGISLSYGAVERAVDACRGLLRVAGIDRGDAVAIYGENMPAWPVAYLAVATYPATVVPILPDFPPGDVGNILDHSGVRAIFVSSRLHERIRDELAARPGIRVVELESVVGEDVSNDVDSVSAAAVDDQPPSPEDVAAIIYTSGTTGFSKGVVLTHRNIASNVTAGIEVPGMAPGEAMLSLLPLSHTYECTLGFLIPFSQGVSVHYLDRPASPTVLVPALERVRPHLMLSVPLVIEKIVRKRVFALLDGNVITRVLRRLPPVRNVLYRAAGRKLMATFGGRLYFFGVGGAPLAEDVERFLRIARFPYAIGYGLTETAPLLAGCNAAHTRLRSTGPPVRGVELRIRDGEIQAKGPNVMNGYHNAPELTAAAFTDDGWFRTGDIGEIDTDGYVYVRGRIKSVIIGANGENIYPEAIEAVINQFRFVLDSLVLQAGAQLVARVSINYEELRAGARDVTARVGEILEDIRVEVNRRVGAFARIARIEEQVEPFEKTPTFKIKRYLYQP